MKRCIHILSVILLSGCTVTSIPEDPQGQENFFLNEDHSFVAVKCGWLGDVDVFTGKVPFIRVAGSFYDSTDIVFSKGVYSFKFNEGSMKFIYDTKSKIAGVIDHSSTTPCRYVYINR